MMLTDRHVEQPQLTTIEGMTLREVIRRDFDAVVELDPLKPRGLSRTLDVLTQAGFLAVVLYRVGHVLYRRGWRVPARLCLLLQQTVFGSELFPQAEIGPGLAVAHPIGVGVGAGVRIGGSVQLFSGVRLGSAGYADPTRDGFPIIGDGARVFDGAKIFGPVVVGERARVGANVVLFSSIPAGAVAVSPTPIIRPPRDVTASSRAG